MERFSPVLLACMFILFVTCTKTPAFGKAIYESPESEKEVKSAMQTLQDGLDNLEDAVLQENIDLAVKLAHEIDVACHFVCNIDVARSALSKDEQREFVKLRKNLHYKVDSMVSAADEGRTDVVLEQSFKVREACNTCHQRFKIKF